MFAVLISGCSASWHGQSQGREFLFIINNLNGNPVEGVGVYCFGISGKNSISQILAEEINNGKPISNEKGLLTLKHRKTEIYGSYKFIGPFTWGGSSTSLEITCSLMHQGKSIYNVALRKTSSPVVLSVKI